jgi:ferric-dicitrate binding protein FerR (iron transport regulator)
MAGWWWMRPLSVQTAPGATATHTLPDGSTVELNADSRLTYDRSFSTFSLLEANRRVVRLQGEAFFEVEDDARPFVVQTSTANVEVVGTSFSVNSRADGGEGTLVALAEGRLRVAGRAAGAPHASLQPGQFVTVGQSGPLTTARDTSIDRVTVWRRGGFAVTGAPLPDLADALERRFGEHIQLDPSIPGPMRSAPLTLYYAQAVDLEQILHDICMARNLSYRATATGYVLSRAGDTQASRLP